MGQKDSKTKEFMRDNKRFADLCNYFLFDGKQVIKPSELNEKDSTEILSVYDETDSEVYQKFRDVLKECVVKYNDDFVIALLGIENQSHIHYAMPVKNMLYDALQYGTQVKNISDKNKDGKLRGDEWLSGFAKDDKLKPVITITLYWGADEWDAPRCIHDMLEPNVKSSELMKYVENYNINLIAPYERDDFYKLTSELGDVLRCIKCSKEKRAMEELLKSNESYKNIHRDAAEIISLFTNIKLDVEPGKEVVDMCKAWEDQRAEGRTEGRTEGRLEILAELVEEGTVTIQEAAAKLGKTVEQVIEQFANLKKA